MYSEKLKNYLFYILIVFLAVPVAFFLYPKKAEAQYSGIVTQCIGGGALAGGATSVVASVLAVPTTDATQIGLQTQNQIKEGCMDSIAFAIAKILLRSMTQSIVTWINSGFQGDPLFLSNPTQYFGDIAQRQLQGVVWELENSASIFANQAIIAITNKPKQQYDLGKKIAQSCVAQQQRELVNTPPGAVPDQVDEQASCEMNGGTWNLSSQSCEVAYSTGDYTTRLARTEGRTLAEENNRPGFFARVASLFKSSTAQVTQENPFGFGTGSGLEEDTGISDQAREAAVVGQTARCPVTKAEQDAWAKAFAGGNFSGAGGWSAWLATVQNQENSSLGAIISAQNRVATRQAGALDEKKRQVAASQGFLSVTRCIPGTEVTSTDPDTGDVTQIGCDEEVVTPGIAAAGALQEVTGSSLRQAELIDELGEALDQIVNAMINQIVNTGLQSVTSQGGVIGRVGSTLGSSIQTAVRNEVGSFQQGISGGFARQIQAINRYILARRETITVAQQLVTALTQINSSLIAAGENCPQTSALMTGDISKITDLNTAIARYGEEIPVLSEDYAKLVQINELSKRASPAELQELSTIYYQFAWRLPNEGHAFGAEQELILVRSNLTKAQNNLNSCANELAARNSNSSSGGGNGD